MQLAALVTLLFVSSTMAAALAEPDEGLSTDFPFDRDNDDDRDNNGRKKRRLRRLAEKCRESGGEWDGKRCYYN